jgi:predicted HTH domain antitoxin
MPNKIVLEFPADMPEDIIKDKEVLRKGKEAMVLELVRRGQISQGEAAQLLDIDRWTLFDLMAKNNIPMADFSEQEYQRQREDISEEGK